MTGGRQRLVHEHRRLSGVVDLSAAVDVGGEHFLGISDEVNTIHLYKKGVSGAPLASFSQGFPGGETDFEGATRFGNMILWTASHGNNRSGSARPERRYIGFTRVIGEGANVDVEFVNSYTRLWDQWKAWDAANGHGLGANKLKFASATVGGLIPNAPNGFNVEGVTMAPGSTTEAWFGMRAPTITGDDGIERALILPVKNIDRLTSNAVDAELGQPIFLNLGGRSIRDNSKNAANQYLITAGTGDTDDSLKNWALYTWDGNPANDPQFVAELPTNESEIGAWEGIAEVPNPIVPGSRALLTADSGDTGLGKSYGQYVTIGEPVAGPAVATGISVAAKPGEIEISWAAAERATAYFLQVKTPAGAHAPGSPKLVTGTTASFPGLTAGTEYTVSVRSQNLATRAANGELVRATPTQGERVVTTTTVRFEGTPIVGSTDQKLIATISDPTAKGTMQFFNGNQALQDAILTDPVPGCACVQARRVFEVVDGKAEITVNSLQAGLANLQARYTTVNPENHVSSNSAIVPVFNDYRPFVPGVEVTSVTGDRVVGGRVTITAKLLGYSPDQLYDRTINVEFGVRLNDGTARTRMTGDTPETQTGYATFDANGEATFSTTALPAGDHRLSIQVGNYSLNYAPASADELPIRIVAAGPAPEAPELKRPRIGVTVSGPRITNQPLTLTAKLSDRSLAGTVQFFYASSSTIGTPVPVVDGVATYTGTVPFGPTQNAFARFEPAADRDRTASAVSLAVPLLRGTTEPPFPATPATTTTLAITGERVVGEPLAATVTVAAQPEDGRAVYGYVELLDNGTVTGLWPVIAGTAEIDLGGLGAGAHALQARYVPTDAIRSLPSASDTQAFDVAVVTREETEVGATVPATLALTLGTAASFGTFTPGVARDYTAGTTATVTSTAGDATLSVADPSSTTPGKLVNGLFSLPQALKARSGAAAFAPLGATPLALKQYGGPVSNAAEAIEFQQSIGAADALRTGAYAKSLTFTLSTTTP